MVTSRIKVTLVKKIESGEGGMRLPIHYTSILGWSAAAQLVWNLDANITLFMNTALHTEYSAES